MITTYIVLHYRIHVGKALQFSVKCIYIAWSKVFLNKKKRKPATHPFNLKCNLKFKVNISLPALSYIIKHKRGYKKKRREDTIEQGEQIGLNKKKLCNKYNLIVFCFLFNINYIIFIKDYTFRLFYYSIVCF